MTRSAPARNVAFPDVTTIARTAASRSARSMSASSASISSTENTFIVRPGISIVARRTPSASSVVALMSLMSVRARGRSDVFLEVGLAALVERLHAFLRLLGLVVVLDRLDAEEADAADVLAVGVERALRDRQRGRRELVDLLAPLVDLGVELVVRND